MKLIEENGQKFIEINGFKIAIKSDEECAKADYHVCMRVSSGPSSCKSNVGACCYCRESIWYDPRMPVGPKRICTECLLKHKDDMELSA